MDGIYGGGTGPVDQRPWFNIFQRAYDRWSEVSGLTFVYEANDDGAPMGGTNRGVTGVRGDVRIGGRNIDGNFGVLAFNYFPNNSGNGGFDGDMIIDTNDVFYLEFGQWTDWRKSRAVQRIDARGWTRHRLGPRDSRRPDQADGAEH